MFNIYRMLFSALKKVWMVKSLLFRFLPPDIPSYLEGGGGGDFSYFLMLFGQPCWVVPSKHQKHGTKKGYLCSLYYLLTLNILIKAKTTQFFVVRLVGRIISGRCFSKIIIIILILRVGKSKSKNIDHWGKETCA